MAPTERSFDSTESDTSAHAKHFLDQLSALVDVRGLLSIAARDPAAALPELISAQQRIHKAKLLAQAILRGMDDKKIVSVQMSETTSIH